MLCTVGGWLKHIIWSGFRINGWNLSRFNELRRLLAEPRSWVASNFCANLDEADWTQQSDVEIIVHVGNVCADESSLNYNKGSSGSRTEPNSEQCIAQCTTMHMPLFSRRTLHALGSSETIAVTAKPRRGVLTRSHLRLMDDYIDGCSDR